MTSGDDGSPFLGIRVKESSFRVRKGELLIVASMTSPRAAALSSLVCENQVGWWALMSEAIIVSASVERRRVRSGM